MDDFLPVKRNSHVDTSNSMVQLDEGDLRDRERRSVLARQRNNGSAP